MKAKKIFMAALSSLFLFSPSIPLMASENAINTDVVITSNELNYVDMIQSVLDNIGVTSIPFNFDVNSENSI